MSVSKYAKLLGQKGGKARAKKLSPERKKQIAAMGAQARIASLQIKKRLEENFKYLEAMYKLHSPPQVISVKRCKHKLPHVYESKK